MKIKLALLCVLLSVTSVYAGDANLDSMSVIDLYKQVVALNYDYEQLQKEYEKATGREKSLENRMLGGLTMAATGIGGMMLAQGLAEQSADEAAERDMRAYLATFQCKVGDKRYSGGTNAIETPGANQLVDLYTQYAKLAADLKERKAALGMKAGIESEVVIDKATTGLYDDVGVGLKSGAYASIARALQDPNGEDAAKWAKQIEDSKSKTKTGGIVGGVGAAGGAIGNILINGGDSSSDSGSNSNSGGGLMNSLGNSIGGALGNVDAETAMKFMQNMKK